MNITEKHIEIAIKNMIILTKNIVEADLANKIKKNLT